MAKIGFIGLGNMGGPMAANLVKAGHAVIGYDFSPVALDALAKAGGAIAPSAADAVKNADVVITMLPAGEHVREVFLHQGGVIDIVRQNRPLLIDCSTIDVDTARAVTAEAEAAGLMMLDAPVSGGTAGAQNGTLTFMVGGTDDAFARGKPRPGGNGQEHLSRRRGGGRAGRQDLQQHDAGHQHGRRLRRLHLAQKLGLDWDKLHQICSTATANSWALSTYCPAPGPAPAAPSNRDYAAGFAAALMVKDVKLSQAAADATGAPTPLAAQALGFYQQVVDQGDGGKDFSVVFRWLAQQPR